MKQNENQLTLHEATSVERETHAFRVLRTKANQNSAELAGMVQGIDVAQKICHELSQAAGWWQEYDDMPEQYRKYYLGTKYSLIHSECSEGFEGLRKGLADSHLPHRNAEEVELADMIIRALDYAGKRGMDVAGAILEKLAYNQQRADHKPEARAAEGGKTF